MYFPIGKIPGVFGGDFIRSKIDTVFETTYEKFDIVFLELACTYHLKANLAKQENRYADAWLSLAESRYWCAMAKFNANIASIKEESAIDTKKSQAKNAGEAKADKYHGPLKKEAERLYLSMMPEINGWKSKTNAATKIKSHLLAFAKENHLKLSEDQAIKTISG